MTGGWKVCGMRQGGSLESPSEWGKPHTVWPVSFCKCGANMLGREKRGGVNVVEGRWGRTVETVKDGSGHTFIECAAEHGEPPLQVQAPWQGVCNISPLCRAGQRIKKSSEEELSGVNRM